jgi:predicted nuclease of predicted toxin-antitoxin system
MKFLLDECISFTVSTWLKDNGYDVKSVKSLFPGLKDDAVLEMALSEGRILVTCDKDFGEITYFRKKSHKGIILLRLMTFSNEKNIEVLKRVLDEHKHEIAGNFIVATVSNIRIVRIT